MCVVLYLVYTYPFDSRSSFELRFERINSVYTDPEIMYPTKIINPSSAGRDAIRLKIRIAVTKELKG